MLVCTCCDEAINETTYTMENHTESTGHFRYHDLSTKSQDGNQESKS